MEKVKKLTFLLAGIELFGGESTFVICEGNRLIIVPVVNVIVSLKKINLEVMTVSVNEIICTLNITTLNLHLF